MNRWRGLTGLCVAAGLVWLAFADFGVAIPTIGRQIGGSLPALQWANNAFSLVTGALVLASGHFGDLYGRRRLLRIGLLAFGAVSLSTAFAPNVGTLIAGRALMGVGAALILPATLSLIPPMFSTSEQPEAFGVWMAVAWVGQGAGPAIGGLLTSTVGWRAGFWLAAPIALVAYWLIGRNCPESRDEHAPAGIDVAGLGTSAAAAFLLLFGCTAGQSLGWLSPIVAGSIIGALVLAVVFVAIEHRVRDPLLDLRLFALRSFDGALIANTVMNIVFAGSSFVLTLVLQDAKGYSAVVAGLLLLPSTVTILAMVPIGSRVGRRRGHRLPVVAGLLLIALGAALTALISLRYAYGIVLLGLLVLGAGIGLLSTPLSDTAVAAPPEDLAGTAAGTFKMTSMLGGALGVALLVTLSEQLRPGAGGAHPSATAQIQGAGLAILIAGALAAAGAAVVARVWPRAARAPGSAT